MNSKLTLSDCTQQLIRCGLFHLRDYSQLPAALYAQVVPWFDDKEFACCPCRILAEIMCTDMGVDDLVHIAFSDGVNKTVYRKDIAILDNNSNGKPIPRWALVSRKHSKFAGLLYARGFPNDRYPETRLTVYPLIANCKVLDGNGDLVGEQGTLFHQDTIDEIYVRLGAERIKATKTKPMQITNKPIINVSTYHRHENKMFDPEVHFVQFENYVAQMKMLKAFVDIAEQKKAEKKG